MDDHLPSCLMAIVFGTGLRNGVMLDICSRQDDTIERNSVFHLHLLQRHFL